MSTLGEQVAEFVEEHCDVELTDWQRAYLEVIYRPGDPGALART